MTKEEFIAKYRRRLLAYGHGHYADDFEGWERAADVIFGEAPITFTDFRLDDWNEETVE